ncbi:MAG TPA: hypothetical protein VGB85_29665 [Nannocystis sp.]
MTLKRDCPEQYERRPESSTISWIENCIEYVRLHNIHSERYVYQFVSVIFAHAEGPERLLGRDLEAAFYDGSLQRQLKNLEHCLRGTRGIDK